MSPAAKTGLHFTLRAAGDLQGIVDYSWEHWGQQAADRYIGGLEAALDRLKQHPELLKPEPDLHPSLLFYRVNKHFMVCDVKEKSIVVLTILSTSMDIPSQLADLEPVLRLEVETLHARFVDSQKKKGQ